VLVSPDKKLPHIQLLIAFSPFRPLLSFSVPGSLTMRGRPLPLLTIGSQDSYFSSLLDFATFFAFAICYLRSLLVRRA
jgi:hypothetical protein